MSDIRWTQGGREWVAASNRVSPRPFLSLYCMQMIRKWVGPGYEARVKGMQQGTDISISGYFFGQM